MKVDMSASAVTARLKRVEQLRRLCLSLQRAKLPAQEDEVKTSEQRGEASTSEMRTVK